jgi:hypothetical protein
MTPEAERETLWRIIEARDEAIARAHQLYQGLYKELADKQLREKESTLRNLAEEAAARLEIIHSQREAIEAFRQEIAALRASRYYKLGFTLLSPRQVLEDTLGRWRRKA